MMGMNAQKKIQLLEKYINSALDFEKSKILKIYLRNKCTWPKIVLGRLIARKFFQKKFDYD